MIGEYVNTGRGSRVTISPAVPGAQYRITAWALDSGTRRSAAPAVKSVSTGEASEFYKYIVPCTQIRNSKVLCMFGHNYVSSVQYHCSYFIIY